MVEKILQSIKDDEKLKQVTNNLEEARKIAQAMPGELKRKEGELKLRLKNFEKSAEKEKNFDITDVDKFESEILSTESESDIKRKIGAVRKVKYMSWDVNKTYRKAQRDYLTYILPILNELDNAQIENYKKINEINLKHEAELDKFDRIDSAIEKKVQALFAVAGEAGMYGLTRVHDNLHNTRSNLATLVLYMIKRYADIEIG